MSASDRGGAAIGDIAAALDPLLARLRRRPDLEAPELRAHDAADRLLLELAATDLVDALAGREVVVIGDTHGALTLGALALGARHVRVHQDSIVAERALAENAAALGLSAFSHHPLAEVASTDARLALVRLPRALDALDAIARDVARGADPEVVLLAAGMVKHMSLGANDVLRGSFDRLDVSLAQRKARALLARSPRPAGEIVPLEPARGRDDGLGLEVVAVPGAFAGASVDIGARALIAALDRAPRVGAGGTVIDLACGTGLIATALARLNPAARVIASDVSAAAVASARLTAAANGVEIEVVQDDGLGAQPDA
ncbi:MAG: methyltransferase, partial [Actinomycetes bacterium]